MVSPIVPDRSLRLFGHRGAHGPDGPVENTLDAFAAAIDAGADMIELDVWQTSDDELAIYHDARLPGQAVPVADMPWSAVRSVPLARGARVPCLGDALALARGRIPVNVELKHRAALNHTLALVRDLRMEEEVVLSSFDLDAMFEAAERAPEIPRALLMGTPSRWPGVRLREAFPFFHLHRAAARFWHAHARLVARPLVAALHDQGVRVHVWTVNDPAEAIRLAEMGVDGIFTDRPAEMRAALVL